jgi:aerobic-type carbon monoxide dehydrogenase small subunit (CoxS/CutS family)
MNGNFTINGAKESCRFSGAATLLRVLRDLGHTEVKEGCGEGQCGACLVLLDGRLVNSCQVLAGSALGCSITTVKGIGTVSDPHPIQKAFVDAGAVQCGFCTPGMVLAAYSLLRDYPDPSPEQIKRGLDGNLCRCTGYVKIIEAVTLAARRMRDGG